MLCLHLQAPFAAFRTFSAGSFRPTAGFITPSAAYGLLLNVASIQMREEGLKEMTLIAAGLPKVMIALGALYLPSHQSMYQQLHNYPVGNTGIPHAPYTKGSKYNITPVRRSYLSDLSAYLCLDGNDELQSQVVEGLSGHCPRQYGLPFLGDNNFLIDRLERVKDRLPSYWFVRAEDEAEELQSENATRLTISIHRSDMSRTVSALFAPTKRKKVEIPQAAWVEVGY